MKIQNAFRLGLFGGLGVLVAILIGAAVGNLATILTYVGAALFLALGLDPMVSFLERHRFPRPAAILTVLVGVLGLVVGLVLAIIPVVAEQVGKLVVQVQDLVAQAMKSGDGPIEYFQKLFPSLDISLILSGVSDWFARLDLLSIGGGVLKVGFDIAAGAFGGVIVLTLTLYFVSSLSNIKRGLYQLVPASKRPKFIDIAEQIADSVGRYVVGQATLAATNGVLSFIFLSILGAKYAALLAFLAFLFSLIPLVGSLSGSTVIVLSVLLFNGTPAVFWAAGYYLVYMQVEAYLLTPRIMNRAVKVPGVVIVIAALSGGALGGVLGALVAIPMAASILIIVKQVLVPRQEAL